MLFVTRMPSKYLEQVFRLPIHALFIYGFVFVLLLQSVSQQPPSSVSTVQSSQQPAAPRPSYAPLTALSSMKPPGSSGPGPGPGPEHHPGPSHHRRHPHHHHHHHHQYNSAFSAPPQPQPAHGQANGGVSSDASDINGGKHHELQPAPLPPPAPPPPPYAHGEYSRLLPLPRLCNHRTTTTCLSTVNNRYSVYKSPKAYT